MGFGRAELVTMLNVAYRNLRETEPVVPIENNSAADLQLIVPNLHRRYSGVTATNRMVAPKLAKMFRAAWLGPDAPDGIARMGVADLLKLWRRRTPLIWHARRNNEMIVGVLLRALGWPLKLVFTSAAQRHHSWITRWLIRRMDAIIATCDISASFLKRDATVVIRTASIPIAMRRRPIARRRSRKRNCRAVMRSAVLAGCARKRAPTCLSRRCAGCCRAIPISPR